VEARKSPDSEDEGIKSNLPLNPLTCQYSADCQHFSFGSLLHLALAAFKNSKLYPKQFGSTVRDHEKKRKKMSKVISYINSHAI